MQDKGPKLTKLTIAMIVNAVNDLKNLKTVPIPEKAYYYDIDRNVMKYLNIHSPFRCRRMKLKRIRIKQ